MRSSQIARPGDRRLAGVGRRGPAPSRSSASSAGNRVIIETNARRMAVPDTKPNSRMPWKSVSISTKNAPVAVSAPSSMPGAGPLGRPANGGVGRRRRAPSSSSIAVEQVHAVVDADAHHDGDEHHREDAEVADDERDDAHRPGEAHHQRAPACSTGLTTRRKAPMRSAMVSDEGQDRRHLAVVEGGGHLVVRDGRAARHTRLGRPGSRAGGAAMVPANGLDRAAALREVALLPPLLHEQEQPVPVGGEEVAGVGIVEAAHREGGGPR